jgi:hypothetical protein
MQIRLYASKDLLRKCFGCEGISEVNRNVAFNIRQWSLCIRMNVPCSEGGGWDLKDFFSGLETFFASASGTEDHEFESRHGVCM